jgi:putative glutamine amidotransferase
MHNRPKIAIVGRFTERATAIRLHGVVSSRRLLEAVWEAGGEPITFLPVPNPNWNERLEGCQGVLITGGGDINPKWYGEEPNTDVLYGVDDLQDENDFSIARYALDNALPVLAICRGFQIINVLRGGSLVQDMVHNHRNHIRTITVEKDWEGLGLSQPTLEASCFHHQAVKALGQGLEIISTAPEGPVEAFKIGAKAWAYGVQWHPEDNATTDRHEAEIFMKLVSEAAKVTF